MTKVRGQDMYDVEVPGRDDTPRVSDLVELYKFPDGKFGALRFIGPIYAYCGHWVKTKRKDGSKGSFYAQCSGWDTKTGKFDSTKQCAWCDNSDSDLMGERTISKTTEYYSNAIDRKAQRNKPEDAQEPSKKELKDGFITKDSDTWTPVRAVRTTSNTFKRIRSLRDLNVHEDENGDSKAFTVSHPKFGMDVNIKYNSKADSPGDMYEVQRGECTPLKKSEKGYLIWNLGDMVEQPSYEETLTKYNDWYSRITGKKAKNSKTRDEDDDDDFEDTKKSKGKKRPVDDDDDDDFEYSRSKKKKRPVEDEDDDFEDSRSKKKKRPVEDEDDDEDFSSKKSKVKNRPVDDEDDEDDDDL